MFIDFRTVEEGTAFEADVCIVGAGAAGISLARTLAATRLRVLLVESGDFEPDPDTQGLYAGGIEGQPYVALDVARLRYFGGTTNHWGGMCLPLQPIDLRERPWVALSGWPIAQETLKPYLEQAGAFLGLHVPQQTFDSAIARLNQRLPFGSGSLEPCAWSFSHPPLRVGPAFRDEIAASGTITVLLNANAVGIRLSPSGLAVDGIALAALNGRRGMARARAHVLACGGIETPRLMLASNDVQPEGVGNAAGWVGRCFMEHPEPPATATGLLVPNLGWAIDYRMMALEAGPLLPHLRLSEAMQEAHGVLNAAIEFKVSIAGAEDEGYAALSRLRQGTFGWNEVLPLLGGALTAPGDVWRGIRARIVDDNYVPRLLAPARVTVRTIAEQSPDPENRIMLTGERDALNMPTVALRWRLNRQDKATVRAVNQVFATELGRLGLGRLRLAEWLADDESWPEAMEWGYHHMGTTRMSLSPRDGVVDPDCQVHGVDGLYVAGASVFPTAGYANPTLNLVALALRLADHLKDRLG